MRKIKNTGKNHLKIPKWEGEFFQVEHYCCSVVGITCFPSRQDGGN